MNAERDPWRETHICQSCERWKPEGERATSVRGRCKLDGKLHCAGSGCMSWESDWRWARREKPKEQT